MGAFEDIVKEALLKSLGEKKTCATILRLNVVFSSIFLAAS